MAGLPASIGNTVLVDVGFVLRFEWYVLAFAGSAVGSKRFDFSLVTAHFFEVETGSTHPNLDDPAWGHP